MILVVDDDQLMREGTAAIVRSAGFEVEGAPDGEDALCKAHTRPSASLMVGHRSVYASRTNAARCPRHPEGIAIQKRVGAGAGLDFPTRLLTDVTGPFHTVVLELTVPNLAAFEGAAPQLLGDKDWQANYQKIASLVESGSRGIFTLVE